MPTYPLKPCHAPGCRSFAVPGKSRCASHLGYYDHNVRKVSPELARAAIIRGTSAWRKLRKSFVATHPVCCDPYGEHTLGPVPTEDVHHVLPLLTHPHLALEPTNLRPLCRSCHNRIEASERMGEPTQHLFDHHACWKTT